MHEVPSLRFSNESDIFIRNGGTIDLTCTATSVKSVEEIIWKVNDTVIAHDQTLWRSKVRKCATKEKENCIIETAFDLKMENVSLSDTGLYTCSIDSNFEPTKTRVRVIDRKYLYLSNVLNISGPSVINLHKLCYFSEPKIILSQNLPESWESQIIEFAIEALELHGLNQVSLLLLAQVSTLSLRLTDYLSINTFPEHC